MKRVIYVMALLLTLVAMATVAQDDKTTPRRPAPKAQPKLETENETIPDSLLHPRWKIQRTAPVVTADLDSSALDLRMPENVNVEATYDDSLNMYFIGSKIGDSYLNAPILMTPDEYVKWSERKARQRFFREADAKNAQKSEKEKFSFADMNFDLGPAEKIFGPGGVRVKTQGSAELKVGATLKNVENPSLPVRNRKTTSFDFDEKINLNVTGKVGDKMNLNLNYNTDATFDFDTRNIKLKYDGKEDEIIKLVEAGNVSFPSNNSLVTGASSLFGIRTDLQFGKLSLQTVLSQKKSSTKNVSAKGGVQTNPFEIDVANYEENRHFFLSHFFREKYDQAMSTLPTVNSGITINRVEVWVTNKSGNSSNTRNIVAFADLGENRVIGNPMWQTTGMQVPSNLANSQYQTLVQQIDTVSRTIDQVSVKLESFTGMTGGVDYERLSSARLLSSSEYTLSPNLGYISLKTELKPEQVVAIAYEYTYNGQTYQVGEFSTDLTQSDKCLFVKSLKNTSNNPSQYNWNLMMKNVYYLASSVEKEQFRLDIKYQSDTTGVYLSYLPEEKLKSTPLLRVMGVDRLDANMKPHPNGQFDYVSGYTVNNGRIFLPSAEPFGDNLRKYLTDSGLAAVADKYCFDELYDSTKTVARQVAEKDKYVLSGQFKGTSANVISLGADNVPQGSVVVKAGGVTLQEGIDYTVNYSAGEVTILNQSIIDAGTNISVTTEDNSQWGALRKTMFGVNWDYAFNRNFSLGGTLMHLSEQALTTKVNMGDEPLNNTIWGLHLNWTQESQWLTNMLDRLPMLHCTQPSQIKFSGEFAQLIAGKSSGTQDNASYIDDFEQTKGLLSVKDPKAWVLSSVPTPFLRNSDKTTVNSGFDRALLSWYYVDNILTSRSSSYTPSHIKSDLEQLSNHYVREVFVKELYPNRDQNSYSGATTRLDVLNLAYYPKERGPYNLTLDFNSDGTLQRPADKWGGMMRRLETTDFEQANIEYVEFWLLDPFIYTRKDGSASRHSGELYLNLGEVSEDVLRDGKKFYESGMPVDGTSSFETTQWGKIPVQATQTYAFATSAGSRQKQDVGLNGLTDDEERTFGAYADWLNSVGSVVQNDSLMQVWRNDPAGDNYHYFRGSDYDQQRRSILDRYKYINNPQGNSPASDNQTESYDTSYKTGPDVEDINQDFTLNEYERYYQYRIPISDDELQAYNRGSKGSDSYIVDHRDYTAKLRNGDTATVRWYQYRVPLVEFESKVGSINDFTSIRFMRMFLTGFEEPIVLRFGSLDLVRGDWRQYKNSLQTAAGGETGVLEVSAVNVEENTERKPVAYVLPPGIMRATDPGQPQLTEENEQSLCLMVKNLSQNESKAVYKNVNYNLRQYKRLQMFVHANHLVPNSTQLEDNQLALFIRLGSDYKNNYYEYLIPLKLTPEGSYRWNVMSDRPLVWPEENMLDINMDIFTDLKKARNKARSNGTASYTQIFSQYDPAKPNNKVSIVGNPTLSEVKTMIIGVRNLSGTMKSGEVWVNELRMKDARVDGGWAASGTMNVQLSDVANVNMTGRYVTDGFGGLEETVMQRSTDTQKSYAVTTSVELGKFFPEKAKVSAPLYYSYSRETVNPKYNPMDTDMELDDALNSAADRHERDSIENIAVTKRINSNFSITNARVDIKTKRHPMPYDPGNFSFSYSHSHRHNSGNTIAYENEDEWKGSINYSYTPVYKTWEPFKKSKSKSKWMQFPKALGLNYLPQNITFNTEMKRNYRELQERDMDNLGNSSLPLSFSEQFLWNREFSIRWDLTKNLHMNFHSATNAEIEEPYTPINKDLYPDRYEAWKDSVWNSIRHLGTPLDYNQSFTASYQLPLDKLPIFNWMKTDASYTATYSWMRGTELDDGTTLGNTIANNRNLKVNGAFNMETLYNHVPFLKKTNERFKRANRNQNDNRNQDKKKNSKEAADKKDDQKEEKALPKNKNSYQKEITLLPDSQLVVKHDKKSKRLMLSARDKDGKTIKLKWKTIDENSVKVWLPKVKQPKPKRTAENDSTAQDSMAVMAAVAAPEPVTVKLSVTPKQPAEENWWYNPAQQVSRFLMMLRSVNVSYTNQFSMTLPGFLPNVGDAFGQRTGSVMSPGLDFAFGMIDNGYIDKARNNGWLMSGDSLHSPSPATSSAIEDLQLRAVLEPVRDLKIDLMATRSVNKSRNVQFMYAGSPTTYSGSFTMTTISLRSALEGMGDANNGYRSKSFDEFCRKIASFRRRVQGQYPAGQNGAPVYNGQTANNVDPYSADVLIPAFLDTYTSGSKGSLDIFPALTRLLPNWSLRYAGLGKLSWFRDHFKSVNISHAYKSFYQVGSYSSYSSWMPYMGDLGYVQAADGSFTPSSRFNVSTVSIQESFSPLLGMDVTLLNNLTCKLEYRTDRNLNLSMTSVQINESKSKDWVVGLGYKISNFNLFGRPSRKARRGRNKNADNNQQNDKNASQGINRDLNTRLDVSFRQQSAITRDIATGVSSASNGNKALKISFAADYTLSKMLTLSAYYDRQTNTPLLSSSSYPTTTQDFGLSVRFSLTR